MIEIYGTENCSYCKAAVDLAKKLKEEYVYIDIDHVEDYDALIQKLGPFRTVPQIVMHGHPIGGFDMMKELLCN